MTLDEIQLWMFIAFAAALILGVYKVYILFNAPVEGMDPQTQYTQLQDQIISIIKEDNTGDLDADTLFHTMNRLEILKEDDFKNFNRNRFNQLIQQLFYRYGVNSLEQLIRHIHHAD